MGIGNLRKLYTTHKTLKKQILDTKQVSNASITEVGASNYVVQYLSWKHTCMEWRGNGIKPKSIETHYMSQSQESAFYIEPNYQKNFIDG